MWNVSFSLPGLFPTRSLPIRLRKTFVRLLTPFPRCAAISRVVVKLSLCGRTRWAFKLLYLLPIPPTALRSGSDYGCGPFGYLAVAPSAVFLSGVFDMCVRSSFVRLWYIGRASSTVHTFFCMSDWEFFFLNFVFVVGELFVFWSANKRGFETFEPPSLLPSN